MSDTERRNSEETENVQITDDAVMSTLENITNCMTGRFKRFDNTSFANFKTANKDAW